MLNSEAVASGMSIERKLACRIEGNGPLSLADILDRVNEVPAFGHVVARAGQYIGVVLSGMILLLNPHVVLLGGVLTGAGDVIMRPMKHELVERVGDLADRAQLAEHREDAAVYGALELAFASADAQNASS
jgi:predicted NBD/HSP70 family sugar kinase